MKESKKPDNIPDAGSLIHAIVTFLTGYLQSVYVSEYGLIAEFMAREAEKAAKELSYPEQDAQNVILASALAAYPFTRVNQDSILLAQAYFEQYPGPSIPASEVMEVLQQLQEGSPQTDLAGLVYDIKKSVYSHKFLFKVENVIREEIALFEQREFKDAEWPGELGKLMGDQHFQTEYGRRYAPEMEKNRERLSKEIKKREKKRDLVMQGN